MEKSPLQRKALAAIAAGEYLPSLVREDDGWHARWVPLEGDNPWIDEYVRRAVVTPLSVDAEDQRHDTLHDAWIEALRSRTGLLRYPDGECAAFAEVLKRWHGRARPPRADLAVLTFTVDCAAEGQGNSTLKVGCAAPHGRRALRALGEAVQICRPLCALRRQGRDRLVAELAGDEAARFLREGARELVAAGFTVGQLPVAAQIGFSAVVESPRPSAATQDGGEYVVKPEITVDGERVTAEEVRFLLAQRDSFVFFRNRWIEVDRDLLRQALAVLERTGAKIASPMSALGFASGLGAIAGVDIAAVRARGGLRSLLETLRRRAGGFSARCPALPGLHGELYAYQRRGVAWLKFLTDHGFGPLLADDMGLGKTLQTIAWILAHPPAVRCDPESGARRPVLVVAPLTLLANWRHELGRFAPELKVYVHQGDRREFEQGYRRAAAASDVVLTSYSLLARNDRALCEVEYFAVVLDEAQAIKNPDTRVWRAARSVRAARRIALTGTPVENSAADIWAIEGFLNPGLLGEKRDFAARFVRPSATDPECASARRLAGALEPFVLRRLKTESEIAATLGEKREIREYCQLTPVQRADYERALDDYRCGERRSGDIFALITRLKIVCDGEGKFLRLCSLLESIFAAGESVLVFTQYAKVARELRAALAERFGEEFPFLHGALDAAERTDEIERFNAPGARAFLLSLKAGGAGLNLVKATHVVHYDRWWNPAVENQATDRAYRIGQRQTVFVHYFITEGTLEERVDGILVRKGRLAGSIVAGGETFLRKLAPDEFEALVALPER